MGARISRRSILRGDLVSRNAVRPPGTRHEEAFHTDCIRCGECVRACPQEIIVRDRDGFPSLDFVNGACTFCHRCIEVCPTGALTSDLPWNWEATIALDCLSRQGVACRTCQDFCDEHAIGFRLQTGGRAEPDIDTSACTGCGACIGVCPVGAVALRRSEASAGLSAC